jgi:hypothetical protein
MNFIRERYAKKWLVDIAASIHDPARTVLRGRVRRSWRPVGGGR